MSNFKSNRRGSQAWRRRMVSFGKGQGAPFVGVYDAIPNLVHIYEPARCTLSTYSGNPLVRLRRSSDDAESDFSHVSSSDPELDVAAIAVWAGGAPAYVVTIYDQVNGDDITQATDTAQPLFVASIQNGHAGGRFDGSNHYLQGAYTTGGALSQPFSVYAVAKSDVANDNLSHYLTDGNNGTNRSILFQYHNVTPDGWAIYAGVRLDGGASDTNLHIWSALFNGANSQFWLDTVSNGGPANAGTQNPNGLTVGGDYSGIRNWDGDIMSIVVADPSHTSGQRAATEAAINTYWNVY